MRRIWCFLNSLRISLLFTGDFSRKKFRRCLSFNKLRTNYWALIMWAYYNFSRNIMGFLGYIIGLPLTLNYIFYNENSKTTNFPAITNNILTFKQICFFFPASNVSSPVLFISFKDFFFFVENKF